MAEYKGNEENGNETIGAKLRNILTPYMLYFQLKNDAFLMTKERELRNVINNTEKTCLEHIDRLVELSNKVKGKEADLDSLLEDYIMCFQLKEYRNKHKVNVNKLDTAIETIETKCEVTSKDIKELSSKIL